MLKSMDHPNIVKYKDHMMDEQNLYIVMGCALLFPQLSQPSHLVRLCRSYCEGGDLHSKIKEVLDSIQGGGDGDC